MKTVKRWRYYCEHCKKSGFQSGAMKRHEASCTLNPSRECRMCTHNDDAPEALSELKKIVASANMDNRDAKLIALREAAAGCAACMIAAARQTQPDFEADSGWVKIDFKKEIKRFWDEHPRQSTYQYIHGIDP